MCFCGEKPFASGPLACSLYIKFVCGLKDVESLYAPGVLFFTGAEKLIFSMLDPTEPDSKTQGKHTLC